jgi:hypothetical protein
MKMGNPELTQAVVEGLRAMNIAPYLFEGARPRNLPRINPANYSFRVHSSRGEDYVRVGEFGLELVARNSGNVLAFFGLDRVDSGVLVRQIQGFVRKGGNDYDLLRLIPWDHAMLNVLGDSLKPARVASLGIEPARLKPGYHHENEGFAVACGVVDSEELEKRRCRLVKRYDEFALTKGFVYDKERGFFVKKLVD